MTATAGRTHALDLHPVHEGHRYTLRGLFRASHAAERAVQRLADEGKEILRFTTAAPDGVPLHAVAVREAAVRQRRARIPHDTSIPWQAVRIAMEAFRAAETNAAKRGAPLRWYKALEEDKLRDTVLRYDWQGSRLEVAAGILSDTVLVHPFPNANHRTSTALARTYLASEGIRWPPYELRGRGFQRFIRETDPHLLESKYLLQLRRHPLLLRVAHEHGFTHLEVKAGGLRPVQPLDLMMSLQEVEGRHRALFGQMIRKIDGGTNAAALATPGVRRLRDWVAWYYR